MDDLLGQWDNGGATGNTISIIKENRIRCAFLKIVLGRGMSNHNSPDRIEDNRSWHSVGGNNFNSTQHQDIEEVS